MPDKSAPVPTVVRHYAAYLQAKAHITPETSINGGKADVRISTGEKALLLVFDFRKKKWSLRSVEVRRGEQTASFTRGELAKAIAALLGHEPPAPTKQVITSPSAARTDGALRERRMTVIRI